MVAVMSKAGSRVVPQLPESRPRAYLRGSSILLYMDRLFMPLTFFGMHRTMVAPWLTAGTVLILLCGASAQTITQLVPGFQATPGFTVSTDITTLTTSGQFVTVSSYLWLQPSSRGGTKHFIILSLKMKRKRLNRALACSIEHFPCQKLIHCRG